MQRLGGAGDDKIDAMSRLPDGAIALGGAFEGEVRFGPHAARGAVRSAGGQDAFVARMSASGEVVWVTRFGSEGDDFASAVTVGPGSDFFVTGVEDGRRCFVARLAGGDGHELWRTVAAGEGVHLCRAIDIAPSGEIVVVGSTQGEMKLEGRTVGGGRSNDLLVARLSATDGRIVSTRVLGGGGDDLGRAVAVRRDGDLYLGGQFSGEVAPADGSLDLGGDVLTSHGDFDAIIARLRPGGEVVWGRGFGGPGFDLVKALALDAADGVLAVGPLQRPADYGSEPPFFAGGFDAYLARHAPGGAFVWKDEIVSDDSVQAHDVAVDDAGGIWVSGHFRGTVEIGGRRLRSSGGVDAWGAIFGSDGRVRWASAFGGDGDELSYAVATDSRSIVIAGAFSGRTSLCGQLLESRGGTDAYILRVHPSLRPR
jgi:hypothetical protein